MFTNFLSYVSTIHIYPLSQILIEYYFNELKTTNDETFQLISSNIELWMDQSIILKHLMLRLIKNK